MPETATVERLQINLLEHPAVRAWNRLHPLQAEPRSVVVLKPETKKSAVYRLDNAGPAGSPVIAKRCKLARMALERAIYGQVLSYLPLPKLQFYGSIEEPDGTLGWIFLEDAGDERFSPGSYEHRALAGQWFGVLHTSRAVEIARRLCLPNRGLAYHRNVVMLAGDTIRQNLANPALSADDLGILNTILFQCDVIISHWPDIEEVCSVMTETFVHGDFSAKNVRVRRRASTLEIFPLDWDGAGWGVAADDLSQADSAVYWSVVQRHWPRLTPDVVNHIANIGKMFWNLVPITDEAEPLSSGWVANVMRKMRAYEAGLAEAIRVERWRP